MNTDKIDHLIGQLKQKAEDIAKRGGDVRADISHLVSDASGKFYQAKDGLTGLVKAVAEGAASGVKEALPDKAESVLRSVVDGLTDGLTRSAHAVRLTLEESGASGVHFAKEDLEKIAKDFRATGELFVSTVSEAASRLGGHLGQQVRTMSEHALKALHGAWPSLESAIAAAVNDPIKLGRESVHAGTSAAQQAAGVLFSELGRHLQNMGDKLRH